MDLSKFTVGSKWYEKERPSLVMSVLEINRDNIKFLVQSNGEFFSYYTAGLKTLNDFIPYEEPKPDWKDNYPVGSKWLDDGDLCEIIAHLEDIVILSNLPAKERGDFHAFGYDKKQIGRLTPYKAPASGVFWVNVHAGNNYGVYSSQKDADILQDRWAKRIACVKVEWTEGEGL